ncbi:MAG: VWA domain-containing protein, partial [Syntrophomonadaceae bacterium]|nr:VWA domain-containing protein [Syntrophomonadaceae bacterium]
ILELAGGLRSSGIKVGTSDLIDALNALSLIKTPEREVVFTILRSALVKEQRHFEVFEYLFAQIFYQPGAMKPPPTREELERWLNQAEWDFGREAAYQSLVQDLVEDYLRQREANWISNQQMLDLIASRIANQASLAMPGLSSGGLSGTGQGSQFLAIIRRQVAGYQYRRRRNQNLAFPDSSIRQLFFQQASPEQQQQLSRLIRQLAKKIANRKAGITRPGGKDRLNFRRLWRRSLSTGGIPVELCWQRPPKKKSRLFVLLDVSNSMRSTVSFFLELLFALHDEFSRIRVFLFVSALTEITEMIDKDDLNQTIDRIVNQGRMGVSGPTDYGEAFGHFCEDYLEELTGKTTVIILGDGRNNQFPSGEEHLLEIKRKCENLFWLNPEPPWQWEFGDSYMNIYKLHCDEVFECRNLEQLERFIEILVLNK